MFTGGTLRLLAAWLSVIAAWAYAALRVVPSPNDADYQVFVSVADRLRAGDRLYIDVWDNKDPIFYYQLALARELSEQAAAFLDVLWILVASAAVYSMARQARLSPPARLAVAFAGVPVVLTGVAYNPGFSHLIGVSLTLSVYAGAVRGRWAMVGVLGALVLFAKLVMAPIAAVALLLPLLRRDWRSVAVASAAGASVVGVFLLILYLRGELLPWWDAQLLNVRYSQSTLLDPALPPWLGHLQRIYSPQLLMVVAATITVLAANARRALSVETTRVLWHLATASLIASMLVLCTTALWPHHGLVLAVPALLALLVLAATTPPFLRFEVPLAVPAILAVAAALSGPVTLDHYYDHLRAPTSPAYFVGPSSEAESVAHLEPTTMAALGTNGGDGLARGLGEWTFVCRHLFQYPFDPAPVLQETLECLPQADAIVVGQGLDTVGPPEWREFVAGVTHVLDRYDCQDTSYGQLCLTPERRLPTPGGEEQRTGPRAPASSRPQVDSHPPRTRQPSSTTGDGHHSGEYGYGSRMLTSAGPMGRG